MRFNILIRGADRIYRAYCPGLPTLVATGASLEQARRNFTALLVAHLESRAQAAEPLGSVGDEDALRIAAT